MMINRQSLKHIISGISSHTDYYNSLRNLGIMALVFKDPFVAGVHGITRMGGGGGGGLNEQGMFQLSFPRKGDSSGKVSRINGSSSSSSEFNLRCSLDHFDDVQKKGDRFRKAHAIAPFPELLRDSMAHLEEGKKSMAINGDGGVNRGSPIEFADHPRLDKLVVAVDVDEVLGNFVSALNEFIADRYSSKHSVSEYHVYEFFKIWNCSRDEADIRVHEFFKTSYFKKGILPIPGARNALHKLSKYCDLSIVTSRQHVIKDHTIEWIENHYPGLFQEIHFGNHFALDGNSRPKSDICRSLGAHVLIDDNPRYAIECADVGMRVLLFDYENMYPWSKTHSATQHPLVTKVHNWFEVEKQLLAWVTS